ncbi:MAG: TIR domain-containing protein [Rubripirellula sp.]
MNKNTTPPKVFISYSWTSEEHTEWVADLGERLMNDGIEVILDQWSLEDGHDVNAFMEKMVSDPSVKRVIIISDAKYAAKADGRAGGVGTETQIISQEVYESADQTKFVPLLRERNKDGHACLPIYLKGRKYIDFSNSEDEAEAYDQLIRNILERPKRRKPALGKPPAHLFDDELATTSCVLKAKRFRDFVLNGRGNPTAAFEDFCSELLSNLEELRMTYSREDESTWCERLRANIAGSLPHRDAFVDVVSTGARHMPEETFMPMLLSLLESLLALQERPETKSRGSFFKCSEDNFKYLVYEFFLYAFTTLVSAKKFDAARQLIDYTYVSPRHYGGTDLESRGFRKFQSYPDSLEGMCGESGNSRRLSVMADLIHERSNRKDLRFGDLAQADVLLCIASKAWGWFPKTLIYANDAGKFELFLRAVDEKGFSPLKVLLALESPNDLLNFLQSEDMSKVMASREFFYADVGFECMNFQQLQNVWQPNN